MEHVVFISVGVFYFYEPGVYILKIEKSTFEFLGHVPSYHLLQQRNCKWGFHFQSQDEGYNLRHFWNNAFNIKLAKLAFFGGLGVLEASPSGNPNLKAQCLTKLLKNIIQCNFYRRPQPVKLPSCLNSKIWDLERVKNSRNRFYLAQGNIQASKQDKSFTLFELQC